jgi:hypothetical protein
MKNRAWRSILTLPLLLVAQQGWTVPFLDFYGYSYSGDDPLAVGNTETVAMRLNTIQPDPVMSFDFSSYEVTILIEGLRLGAVEPHGTARTLRYDGGEIRIYQDPSKDSGWPADPPNGSVPAAFRNGELVLVGYFSDCVMLYDTVLGTGVLQGHVDFTGGSRWGELGQSSGWLFSGGTTTDPQGQLPGGYSFAWDPQLIGQAPVATRRSTWGGIKGVYR